MGLSSKIFLDERYTKRNGERAIKIRITLDRKSLEMPVGYSVLPEYWNEKTSSVKSSCKSIKNVMRLNNRIKKIRIDAEDKIIKLQDNGLISSMTMKQIKAHVLNKLEEKQLLQFTDEIISELKVSGRVGNARVYQTLRNSIDSYLDKTDIPLRSVTYLWLKSYEAWYLGRGNSVNGLSVHMRTLRAVINRAIKQDLLSQDDYPFTNYSLKTVKTKKRAISKEELDLIKGFVPKTIQQGRAKDYFLMSFYLMGASFIDLAFLKLRDIKHGRIEYRRKKTGKLHTIKITPSLHALLEKYTKDKNPDDFILNVIKSTDVNQQYINARDELKRYNKRIRDIGKICGIPTPLSSYVARHSFATIAKFKDVPISVISQALGHSNAETTEIYLAEFGNDIMDKYNEQIVE